MLGNSNRFGIAWQIGMRDDSQITVITGARDGVLLLCLGLGRPPIVHCIQVEPASGATNVRVPPPLYQCPGSVALPFASADRFFRSFIRDHHTLRKVARPHVAKRPTEMILTTCQLSLQRVEIARNNCEMWFPRQSSV